MAKRQIQQQRQQQQNGQQPVANGMNSAGQTQTLTPELAQAQAQAQYLAAMRRRISAHRLRERGLRVHGQAASQHRNHLNIAALQQQAQAHSQPGNPYTSSELLNGNPSLSDPLGLDIRQWQLGLSQFAAGTQAEARAGQLAPSQMQGLTMGGVGQVPVSSAAGMLGMRGLI
jgi:hypothetical protein